MKTDFLITDRNTNNERASPKRNDFFQTRRLALLTHSFTALVGSILVLIIVMSGLSRPQTATSRRQSMTRPTTSVSLARPSDDVSVLTKGTAVGNTIRRDFIRQVKQKEHQILDELQRLQDEMTAMEQTKAMLPSLQNKHSSLTASILQMEGQLTDYNLANDRFSRHVLPSELEEANAALAMNNGVLATELNDAMLDTQEQEDNLQSIKDQVDARYHEIETKMLKQGGEDQLQRCRSLRKVMDNLQTEKKRREEEINDMGEKIEELEDSAEGQGLREREALSTKVSQLQAKLKCLQDEENALAMPISEAREFLMTATEATERSPSSS